MSIYRASLTHLSTIRHLLKSAHYCYRNIADEDIARLLDTGLTLIGEDDGAIWGVIAFAIETRPSTLPASAAQRAGLSLVALRPGHWPSDMLPLLFEALASFLPPMLRPLQISAHAQANWLGTALTRAGFELVDRVCILVLDPLARQPTPGSGVDQNVAGHTLAGPAQIETLALGQMSELAQLDALAFDPLWHFGEQQLWELMLRGIVRTAVSDHKLVGYSALLPNSRDEVQLARLAVHPNWQGQGLGRQLLYDAIAQARASGHRSMALNTQESNRRAQALYRAAGFKNTGEATSVYVKYYK